jgi:hypothetical protein
VARLTISRRAKLVLLGLLIANEIRGILVVVAVVKAWFAIH